MTKGKVTLVSLRKREEVVQQMHRKMIFEVSSASHPMRIVRVSS